MYWMAAWGSLSRPWRGPLVGYWSSSGAPVICAAPLTLFQVPPYVLGWRHGVPCRSPGMALESAMLSLQSRDAAPARRETIL
jgi:hypothetical protein